MLRCSGATIKKNGCRGETLMTFSRSLSNWNFAAMGESPDSFARSGRENATWPVAIRDSINAKAAPVLRAFIVFNHCRIVASHASLYKRNYGQISAFVRFPEMKKRSVRLDGADRRPRQRDGKRHGPARQPRPSRRVRWGAERTERSHQHHRTRFAQEHPPLGPTARLRPDGG